MKRSKRNLAALLAALMLCAAPVVAAEEMEIILPDDGVELALPGDDLDIVIGGDSPEILPDGIAPDVGEAPGISGDAALDGTLDTGASDGEQTLLDNDTYDSADFEINNGVLVSYKGEDKNVVIPDGVTCIGNEAFYGCNVVSVTIPDSVTAIADGYEKNWDNTVGGRDKKYVGAFSCCKQLRNVNFGNGLTYIGKYAFYDSGLTEIVIPNGVTCIGESAFEEGRLMSVTIPNSVTRIERSAFRECDMKSVSIPYGVREIGIAAFFDCNSLVRVNISKTVESIGGGAFGECKVLQEINVSADNPKYASRDGVVYSPDFKTLLLFPSGRREFKISGSVTAIGEYSFMYNNVLSGITLPNRIKSIGYQAFEGCRRLASVTVPASVTSIGEEAFGYCQKLTSAIILSRDIKIGKDAFCNYFWDTERELTLHIVSGSDAITWAKKNGYRYDIYGHISDSALKLKIGETHKLTVNGFRNSEFTWSSSNKKVATVSGGKVKAVGAGKCVVSAKIKTGGTLKCSVTVTDPVKLDKTKLTISAVDSATVKLTGASGKKVTWSSSQRSVAKITRSSSGAATVVGVKPGTAVITAKIAGGTTLKCTVKVVAPLKMTTAKLANESGKRMLYAKFANQSGKKINYIKCDILQYDYRNQKLKSPYSDFDLDATINAHASTTKRVDVNSQTDHVTYRILQIRFSDGTTWKP